MVIDLPDSEHNSQKTAQTWSKTDRPSVFPENLEHAKQLLIARSKMPPP
jgi:hypothetical protein